MATIKISELNPIASGSVIGNNVIPLVSGGATNKISVDDLQGKLRGPSNSICATQSNSTCTQHVLGVQNKINACGVVSIVPNLSSPNTYDGTCINSAYSSILGGVNNKIEGNFVNYIFNSTSYYCENSTNLIAGGANSQICNNGTRTNYSSGGGNSIVGAAMSSVTHLDCGYQPAHNTIVGGQRNTIAQFNTSGGNAYTRDNAIIGSYRSSIQTGASAYVNLRCNRIIGSSRSTIIGLSTTFNAMEENSIIGAAYSYIRNESGNVSYKGLKGNIILGGNGGIISTNNLGASNLNSIVGGCGHQIKNNSKNNAILGGYTSCIIDSSFGSATVAGCNNFISSSISSTIIGGCANRVESFCYAVIAGGVGIKARAHCALHADNLLLETGSIPTVDPGIPGMLYIAGGALKVSGCL